MLADGVARLARPQEKPAGPFEVPDRSLLVVRATGAAVGALSLEVPGGDGATRALEAPAPANAGDVAEIKHRAAQARARSPSTPAAFRCSSWPFQVTPDHPPKIALTKEPERSPRGALKLFFKVEDDYGVVSAETRIRRVRAKEDKTATAWARAGAKKGPRPPLRAAAGAGAAAAARLPQAGRRPKLPRDRRSPLGRHDVRAVAGRQGPRRPDRPQRAHRAGAAGAALHQAAGARRRRAAAPAGRGPARPPAGGPRHRCADAGARGVHRGPAGLPGAALGLLAAEARWNAGRRATA